jgi:micrococcal nuclease
MRRLLLATLVLFLGLTASCAKIDYNHVFISRVIDGDTLELANGQRVRLIGIDTPEMYKSKKLYRDARKSKQDLQTIQELGKSSYAFTRKLAEGKRARLEFDVEKRDRYGRSLAYVFIKSDDSEEIFLNAEIIKQGYASLMTFPPNIKYVDLFRRLYRQAQEQNRGLWKE